MTKFEEELFNKVPCKFELTTEAEYKKTTLINHFKNWHSDEEFQELLDKYSNLNDNYEKEVIRSFKLESQIANLKSQLQQQALPVVPEYVGKFLTDKSILGIANGLIPDDVISWVQEQTYYVDLEKIISHLISIKVTGFTVEKPQLFRLKLKNATISNYYLWLNQATGKVFVDKKFLDWTNHDNVKNIFTEQEIPKISDGAFVNNEAFELVPVEDGE